MKIPCIIAKAAITVSSVLLLLLTYSCTKQIKNKTMLTKTLLIGHRGARGLLPENTLPAFLKAAREKMDYIEFDVVLTLDNKLIIHHNLFTNPDLCRDKKGAAIPKVSVHKLTSSYMESLNCGSIANKHFPQQKTLSTVSPLTLEHLFEQIIKREKTGSLKNRINFLIEIKLEKKCKDEILKASVNRVLYLIKKFQWEKRVIVQSFRLPALSYLKKQNSKIKTAALFSPSKIEGFKLFWGISKFSIGKKILRKSQSVQADIAAVNELFISPDFIRLFHNHNIPVFVWTVNNTYQMKKLFQTGIDGIITDYPNLLNSAFKGSFRKSK